MKMHSFWQLFRVNLKMVARERSGVFWTVLMPSFIYVALSVLPIGKSANPSERYSNYVLPGLIAMTIMQGGIYGLAYWMTDLKARGVIKRFLVTPLRPWQLLLAVVGSRIVVTFAQVVILTLLGVFAFRAQFAGNVISVILLVLLGAGLFLTVGLLIANYVDSYQTAAPITSAIGLPLTFLGNIFYPVDSLPKALKIFAEILPITYLADGLRQAYLFTFNLSAIAKDMAVLSVWFVLVLAITMAVFKLSEE